MSSYVATCSSQQLVLILHPSIGIYTCKDKFYISPVHTLLHNCNPSNARSFHLNTRKMKIVCSASYYYSKYCKRSWSLWGSPFREGGSVNCQDGGWAPFESACKHLRHSDNANHSTSWLGDTTACLAVSCRAWQHVLSKLLQCCHAYRVRRSTATAEPVGKGAREVIPGRCSVGAEKMQCRGGSSQPDDFGGRNFCEKVPKNMYVHCTLLVKLPQISQIWCPSFNINCLVLSSCCAIVSRTSDIAIDSTHFYRTNHS